MRWLWFLLPFGLWWLWPRSTAATAGSVGPGRLPGATGVSPPGLPGASAPVASMAYVPVGGLQVRTVGSSPDPRTQPGYAFIRAFPRIRVVLGQDAAQSTALALIQQDTQQSLTFFVDPQRFLREINSGAYIMTVDGTAFYAT